jgi:hypothetical protein
VKHTRGPWQVLPPEEGVGYLRVRGTHFGLRYKIANVHDEKPSCLPDGEAQANAELIAAAPELLEALEKALVLVGSIGGPDYSEQDRARVANQARAAIAKANEVTA